MLLYHFNEGHQLQAEPRYFIPLGSDHNFGSCYELVCWLHKPFDPLDRPYFGLIYKFEFRMYGRYCGNIHIKDTILILKNAMKFYPLTRNTKNMYHAYMLLGARACLERLLVNYSMMMFQNYQAKIIQSKWLYHYYNPESPIWQRIKLRQLEELNAELGYVTRIT